MMSDELQLSHTAGTTDVPLLDQTIPDNLDATVARFGDREALVDVQQGVRWTYREFSDRVTELARGLLAAGVATGDRVGIWAPNCAEWTLTQYATARIGAILVNINPSYRTHELEYVLNQAGISFLVAASEFRSSNYAQMIEEVRGECPGLREVVLIGTGSWDALVSRAEEVPAERVAQIQSGLHPDDPINIQYTSGTTGFPKGATLSHRNILNNGFFVGELCRYTEQDRVCIPVPLYHCFGMVMGNLACTSHGAAMIYPAESFDPQAVMKAVQQERCTSLYGVPTMFIAELDHPEFRKFDFSTLRTGIMAGSPCPVEAMKRVQKDMHMPEVTICYGMTETSPVSTQSRTDDPLDKRVATVGQIHPHVEIKIVDPTTGRLMPRGTPGEICTRGYSVMLGYWGDPHATHEAIDEGRWMHTGDLGTMDEQGYVKIVGRIKDMVLRGGENIFPREVEEFLYTIPGVSDVQVIGVPDEKYGEELMAWVKLRPGATLTGAEIRAYCKGKIATYKIPRYYKFVDGFPMTVSGKVQKYKMREQSVHELGLEKADAIETA
jgi:fatty-acyl-CoA synthase